MAKQKREVLIIADAQLIYLTDPQCGWCFGYSDTIQDIVAHYQDDERVELSLVTGGLFHPALTTGPEFAEEKRPIAKRVSQTFGVRFSEEYFTNVLGAGRLDSLVPCQAINVVKINTPEVVFSYAKHLIDAAFKQGRNISDISVCLEVTKEYGLDAEKIASKMQGREVAEMTRASFEFARQVGTGFPSLFLRMESGLEHLGGAQLDLQTLKARVEVLMNSASAIS